MGNNNSSEGSPSSRRSSRRNQSTRSGPLPPTRQALPASHVQQRSASSPSTETVTTKNEKRLQELRGRLDALRARVDSIVETPAIIRDLARVSREEGEQEAELTLKTCIELEELLLQHLLALDMVAGGGDHIRTLRKAQVQDAQRLINRVETTSNEISALVEFKKALETNAIE
eukprot:CAMPEP_0174240120 /NCGR_PEP_ID=MMETSP0417-20130205/17494_1 /TAXON_ID=242541 /ORGANISM="Mayorella sp, Strain BSH-02190019" /LENGTH=172 /DNA_ID=CAMNT_0015319155 /DNA_START=86 /DNA_END=602 /DNA_ORIENTATION=-